jgi:hypothetical protein
MGNIYSYPFPNPSSYPIIKDYEAAGVLFIDDKHFLAGYQPKKRWPCITGIGGAKEEGDKGYVCTAFRELFEELFDWKSPAPSLLKRIAAEIQPTAVFQNDSYVSIALSFKDLEKILSAARRESSRSPFYDKFPMTTWELIRNRKILADAEVQQLLLLPIVKGSTGKLNLTIHSELLDDVKLYVQKRGAEKQG